MKTEKAKGKYQPTQSARFYPGRVSEERKKQLENFEIDIEDLTYDDIVHCMHMTATRTLYFLIDVVRSRWGEKAAAEVANEWGRREGRYMYSKFLNTHGLKTRDGRTYGTPELQARYQDIIHIYYGPTAPFCRATYGDDWTRVVRTQCHLHTDRPEGMESVCKYLGKSLHEGMVSGYSEIDAAFVHTEKPYCMAFGAEYCDRTWYYKKMESGHTKSQRAKVKSRPVRRPRKP